MRLVIGFILAAFVASPTMAKDVKKAASTKNKVTKASAKKGTFSYRLLNFQEIARLPKDKRAKYMQEVRELLVLIEGYQNRYEVASNGSFQRYKEQVATLIDYMNLMPEAKADVDAVVREQQAAARKEALVRLSKGHPAHNGIEWICGPGLTFDKWAGTCLLNSPTGATNFDANGAGNVNCPTHLGFIEIPWPDGGKPGKSWISRQRACVPKGSFDRLGSRQKDIKNGKWLEQNFFETSSMEVQTAAVNAPAAVVDESTTKAPVAATPDTAPKSTPTPATTPPTTSPPAAGNTASGVATEAETVETIIKPKPRPAREALCTPPVLKCASVKDPTKIEEAISRFRSNGRKDDAICVSGAFLSKYKDSSKVAGGCEIISKLPYFVETKERKLDCGPDRALCNPVPFCITFPSLTDGKEYPNFFCVDKKSPDGAPITERCDKEYTRLIEGKPWLDKDGKPRYSWVDSNGETKYQILPTATDAPEEKKRIVPKKCDAFEFKNIPIQNEWNKIINDTESLVKNWCANDKNDDLQILICRECQILTEKIWAMNSSVRKEANCALTAAEPAKPAEVTPPPASEPAEAVNEEEDLG